MSENLEEIDELPVTKQEKEEFSKLQDSPDFDPGDLTARQETIMFALLEDAETELSSILLEGEGCPKCGTPMQSIGETILCIPCLNKTLGKGTLKNSFLRMTTIRDVYEKMLLKKQMPKVSAEHLATLVPTTLVGKNIEDEKMAVINHTSKLSTAERKFIMQYVELLDLREVVVSVAKTEEERLQSEKESQGAAGV